MRDAAGARGAGVKVGARADANGGARVDVSAAGAVAASTTGAADITDESADMVAVDAMGAIGAAAIPGTAAAIGTGAAGCGSIGELHARFFAILRNGVGERLEFRIGAKQLRALAKRAAREREQQKRSKVE